MSRIAIYAAVLLAAASPLAAQVPQPVTAPVREAKLSFDPVLGRFVRVPNDFGGEGLREVYDNTCFSGAYLPLRTAAQIGGTESRAVGDFGAIPSEMFPGSNTCVPGCQMDYRITQFEIAYCTATGLPPQAVINFWDIPQSSCTFGPTLIGGVTPPATPTAFRVNVPNLPRADLPGFLSCYAVTLDLGTPGFQIGGGTNVVPGNVDGDRFAYSIQFPTTDGTEGPLIAGDPSMQSPCSFCTGTIWELGGLSSQSGTGFGQDDHVFIESYSGSPPPNDCFQFGALWSGLHLELDSPDACDFPVAQPLSFCDASDGSLGSCPCANPGANNTGCDNSQGTGGVGLQVVNQNQTSNRATVLGSGFPSMSTPAAIVIRSSQLDLNAPVVFGDGLRCVSTAGLVRLSGTLASGGTSTHTFGHSSSMAGPGFFYYQLWYRNTPATFCLAPPGILPYNLSNGKRMYWIQ